MTWSARFADSEGNFPEGRFNACEICKHGYGQFHPRRPCYLPDIGNQIGPLLTGVDIGLDGHMAGGFALLKCYGYEPMPKTE